VPWRRVFADVWPVEIEGVGTMEAYPNRDALAYREVFGLAGAGTVVRATLRWPGFAAAWLAVVRLGLPDEKIPVPDLPARTWAELVEMHLPADGGGDGRGGSGRDVRARAARFLGLDPGDAPLAALDWLGLFSERPIGGAAATPAEALAALQSERLVLPPGGRDMVVLRHELTVRRPDGARERLTSTLVEYGEPGGETAMAKTVGLPAAIGARLVLAGELPLTGCRIPTDPRIYRPVLAELERAGLRFREGETPAER
jgi:saccharopine dehydrogenase-like NADP-dependent oxidoreductase